jgi:L-rhamnonate dehydratase
MGYGSNVTMSYLTQISVRPLPPLPSHAPGVLPDWAKPAVLTPVAQPWGENRHRFVVGAIDDDGITGWFGPVSLGVATIVIDEVAPAVIGSDVRPWRAFVNIRPAGRHRKGAHARLAVTAVELAVWDLRSQTTNTPITTLLGGRMRTLIPAYATALGIDIDHPLAPEIATWIVGEGFWGQKWGLPGHARGEPPQQDHRRLERLRAAVGDTARLCIDARGCWTVDYMRRMLPALAAQNVVWVEEPGRVGMSDLTQFGLVHACGEHDYDPDEQARTLTNGSIGVWQPDPTWNGGLAHCLRMVDLATALGIPCFPHGNGLPVALHLAAVTPGYAVPAVEYHLTLEPLRQAAYTAPLVPAKGAFSVFDEPGLTAPYRFDEGDGTGHAA